jgi:hypothetical protein
MKKIRELIRKLDNVIKVTHVNGRVWQLDDNEELINHFRSVKQASVATGVSESNITSAIHASQKAGGFYWIRNKDEE